MIDLHCHSTFSDGTLTPTELINYAEKKKLTALALTDHDTIDGIDEFLAASQTTSVKAIPGIEFSTSWYGASLHIVGLFIDHHHPVLQKALEKLIQSRYQRNERVISKLRRLGLDLSLTDVQEEALGESIGRPHIARALIKKGFCKTMEEAFNKYLGKDKAAYIRRHLPLPTETIQLIHEIGGVAIWAHPLSRGRTSASRTRNVASRLIEAELDGIECFYTDYTTEQEQVALKIAAELHLTPSGGSDFHGENLPGIDLGCGHGVLNIDDELMLRLEQRAKRYK